MHPEIPFKVKQIEFADKWEAIYWMYYHQIGRRNLTDAQKTMIIGEAYRAQKMTCGGDRKSAEFSQKKISSSLSGNLKSRASERVADDFGVAKNTVLRAEKYVQGVEAAEEISPGFKDDIISGKVTAPKTVVRDIVNTPEDDKLEVVDLIREGKIDKARDIQRGIYRSDAPTPPETMSRYAAKKAVEAAIANTGLITEFTDADRLEMVTGELDAIIDTYIKQATREFTDWPDIVKMDDGTIRDILKKAITATEELMEVLS